MPSSLIFLLTLALTLKCKAANSPVVVHTLHIPSNAVFDGSPVSTDTPGDIVNNNNKRQIQVGPSVTFNTTSSASTRTTVNTTRAGSSSSLTTNVQSNSFGSNQSVINAGLNTGGLQGFFGFLETKNGASSTSGETTSLSATGMLPQASGADSAPNPTSSGILIPLSLPPTESITTNPGVQNNATSSASPATSRVNVDAQGTDEMTSSQAPSPRTSTNQGSSSLVANSSSSTTTNPNAILGAPTVLSASNASTSVSITPAPIAILIPTTSIASNGAIASSDAAILAGALISLSKWGKSLSDNILIVPTKTSFEHSVETLESQLGNLFKDMGGKLTGPPSCSKGKRKSRFKERDILSSLFHDVECAISGLDTLKIQLDTDTPDINVIGPALDDIGTIADDMSPDDNDDDDDDNNKTSDSESETKNSPSKTSINRETGITTSSISSFISSAATRSDSSSSNSSFNLSAATRFNSSSSISSFTSSAATRSNSSSSTRTQTSADWPANTGPEFVDPNDYVDPPGAEEALANILPLLFSSVFGADYSGFVTSTVNSTSNATSITSGSKVTTSPGSLSNAAGILLPLVNSPSNISSNSSSASHPDEPPTQISSLTGTTGTRAAVVTAAANLVSLLANPPSTPGPASTVATESAIIAAAISTYPSSPSTPPTTTSSPVFSAAFQAVEPVPVINPTTTSPLPAITAHNDKGSSLCKQFNGTICQSAYSFYDPDYLYLYYTSYIQSSVGIPQDIILATVDQGCAAELRCALGSKGMYGSEVIAEFDKMYEFPDVKTCGTVYLDNGCWLTANACSSCKVSVPCEALKNDTQIGGGQFPCYD